MERDTSLRQDDRLLEHSVANALEIEALRPGTSPAYCHTVNRPRRGPGLRRSGPNTARAQTQAVLRSPGWDRYTELLLSVFF